jgi:hypothetical protein
MGFYVKKSMNPGGDLSREASPVRVNYAINPAGGLAGK